MSRLREERSPAAAAAAALLRAIEPADAPPENRLMKARVWARLEARPRRAGRSRLLPVFAALAVLAVGAFAMASILRARFFPPARPPAVPPLARPHHGTRALAVPLPPALPSVPLPPPALARHLGERHPSTREAAVVAPDRRPAPSLELEAPALLLQQATRALRFEHDAARAAALADQYLAQHADGDLVEEAFAIAMDAHAQLADGRAGAIAARYLAIFPDGRFRTNAEQLR